MNEDVWPPAGRDYNGEPLIEPEPVKAPEPLTVSLEAEQGYHPTQAIYGGEGFGDVKRRHLFIMQPLPVYLKDKEHPERGIDHVLEGQRLDPDIRDAMAYLAARLDAAARKHSVTGYTWDLSDIEYDIPQPRTVSATLVLERG